MSETIGRIESIWRFPIKSFQGESVEATTLSGSGILGDRVFALRHRETGKILSGKHAELGESILAFEARFDEEPVAGESLPPIQATLAGRQLPVDGSGAFAATSSEILGSPVELVAAGNTQETYETYWPEIDDLPIAGATLDFPLPLAEAGSFADLEPLHILTTSSLRHLAALAPDSEITVSRFRPSVLIDTGDSSGFVENEWTGRTAELGGATIEFGAASPRCIMTTRSQAGLPRDTGVLRTLVQNNRQEFMGLNMPCLGIYAKVTGAGEIRVGAPLRFP